MSKQNTLTDEDQRILDSLFDDVLHGEDDFAISNGTRFSKMKWKLQYSVMNVVLKVVNAFSKKEPIKPIVCGCCGKEFKPFCENQGYGCDSSIHDDEISFGYGSRFDLDVYTSPLRFPTQNLCDDCATKLIVGGFMTFKRNYME